MSVNCWRMMTLLASSSEFECPTDTVACAMKPEHLGGCSQSVQSGVAPDCSGSTFCCSLGYDGSVKPCCVLRLENRYVHVSLAIRLDRTHAWLGKLMLGRATTTCSRLCLPSSCTTHGGNWPKITSGQLPPWVLHLPRRQVGCFGLPAWVVVILAGG